LKLTVTAIQYMFSSRALDAVFLCLFSKRSLVSCIHRLKPFRVMDVFWNRPSVTTSVQPAMELATSRMLGMSNWLSTNKHVKISLAIALPSLALLLSTTPITNKLAQAWRRATGQTSSKKETARPERSEHDTNDTPPELPKKSYGQLPSGKRVTRPERSERGTNDERPEMPEKSHGQPSFGKRATRSERSEHGMKNDNIVYKNNSSGNIPASPKKSYAAAAAATPATPSAEPFSPLTPDSASIASESSSEQSQKHKFRLGKNIKKRWQNRPFGHGHGSSESPLSP
jgi:hypothetical protein